MEYLINRKCESDYPVTSWLPCPPLLNMPDCTSNTLNGQLGRLPLACFPDIGPFANIMPVSNVMKMPSYHRSQVSNLYGFNHFNIFRMQLIYNNIKEYVSICISLISNGELLQDNLWLNKNEVTLQMLCDPCAIHFAKVGNIQQEANMFLRGWSILYVQHKNFKQHFANASPFSINNKRG